MQSSQSRTEATSARRRFRVILVKPSHYDDDGYVIRWFRSPMPANSLATVYGLVDDCAQRQLLGPDVDIDIVAIDETNTRVRVDRIIAEMRANGNFGFVGLVGVQSNQYPRALHIAKPLREAGIAVIIGGFHVSGMLAMFPDVMADLQEALDMGITLFAGEAEGRMDEVMRDAAAGALKPLYNYINDLPALEELVTPFLPGNSVRKTIGNVTTFDAGRGCPFQCSFCTIINVQGRKSRRRSPDDVERILRKNFEHGIDRFFITDDNFARNKDWEPIFDRIIKLREEDGMDVRFLIQVDTLCHKIPNFVAKAKRAGVTRIFIGLENINPDNLLAAKKRQNKITEYRNMLLAWKAVGIWTYAGYILGFPNDTPESARRDIEIIKKEMPLDVLEFFFLTPLPGSEDHKVLWTKGAPLDPDLNKYDLEHALTPHAHMSKAEWEKLYRDSWDDLLHARAHRDDFASRPGLRHQYPAPGADHSLVRAIADHREGASAARRLRAAQSAPRAPPRTAARAGVDVLSGARLGDAGQARLAWRKRRGASSASIAKSPSPRTCRTATRRCSR